MIENRFNKHPGIASIGMLMLAWVLGNLLFAACTMEKELDVNAAREAIDAQNTLFATAYNRTDASAVASIYTEDARALPPNAPMRKGKGAIKKGLQEEFDMGARDLSLQTVSLEFHGNIAHEIGNYTVSIQPTGAELIKDSGKYLAIWEKQPDGAWLINIDIWNSNLSAPTAMD